MGKQRIGRKVGCWRRTEGAGIGDGEGEEQGWKEE